MHASEKERERENSEKLMGKERKKEPHENNSPSKVTKYFFSFSQKDI